MRRNKPSTILEQVADQAAQVFEQAKDKASEFSERVVPAMEEARDRIGPALEDARDRIAPAVQDTKDRIGPAMTDARERIAPAVQDAKERLAPAAADAKIKLATLAEAGAVKAAAMAENARDNVPASVGERLPDSVVDTSKPSKRSRLGKLLLVLGVGAGAAAVAKKLREDKEPVWHNAPVGVPTMPQQSTAPQATSTADDDGGASPDEALADEAETPHRVTTPDDPAETVVLEEQPRI